MEGVDDPQEDIKDASEVVKGVEDIQEDANEVVEGIESTPL